MKKTAIILSLAMIFMLTACGEKASPAPKDLDSAQEVEAHLLQSNQEYIKSDTNDADVSQNVRSDTSENGQSPYAVVVTCSDSRVPPEHIFGAGIGELFVIRTAGNVIGEFELGSVEYGAEHLHTSLVVVLGHTGCGAVDAALNGGAHGNIEKITDEISACLPDGCTAAEAEVLNVENSIARIRESEIMRELEDSGTVTIRGAIYDIATGSVNFLDT